MRALGILALAACFLSILQAPGAAQTPADLQAAQIGAVRKELQRQRKARGALGVELKATQAKVADLSQRIAEQDSALHSLRLEIARIWSGGAVGFAVLFFVLLLIAFRRPRSVSPPDELQQRLAALDDKFKELSPRG